jgi:hypothetical protein
MARADLYTQTQKKQEYFSDFLTDFEKHPVTSGLGRVINENSVSQAIRNLVLTNLGERLFNSQIGSEVNKSLFEPFGRFAAEDLKNYIINCISQNEKRCVLQNVKVYPSEEQNAYAVNIVFSVINNPEPITLDFILRRVR